MTFILAAGTEVSKNRRSHMLGMYPQIALRKNLCNNSASPESLNKTTHMIKIWLWACTLLILTKSSWAQTDPIRAATYRFVINNHQLIGPGADTLRTCIRKSQFFLIGEEHDMTQLQALTTDLFPFLKTQGFSNFVAEIGPVSAQKLTSIHATNASLKDFTTKYYSYFDGGPFGFFDGKEEDTLLTAAFANGFHLCGIDFENYNAPLYLFDELFNLSTKSAATKQ
jgi:hypothetical protein